MWTVVYIAPNRTVAENLRQVLTNEGLLVQLRPVGLPSAGEANSVEILVPESEVEEAHEILAETLSI